MPTDPSSSRTRPLVTRRRFLKWSGAAGVAAVGGAYWSIGPTVRRTRAAAPADTPLKHVVVSMQENRSFDHYFGYAPWIGALSGRPPATASPTAPAAPSRRTASPSLATPDIPHDWDSVHDQWDGGAMDGFMTNAGIWALGYYTAPELPFYYSLHEDSTLCGQLLLLAARADLAEPVLPHGRDVGRDHDERPVGLRDLRLPDDPRPARRGRGHLEDLQPRLGQRALRQHRQRRRVLEALRPRQPDARQQGRVPQRRSQGSPAAGLVPDPELCPGLG